MTADNVGNIYISDTSNERVRKVDIRGNISTFAGGGSGSAGSSGDGGSATAATLNGPNSVAFDKLSEAIPTSRIPATIVSGKVDANGIITTVAGNGTKGYSGDGGSATAAKLSYPIDLAFDSSGNLYIRRHSEQC